MKFHFLPLAALAGLFAPSIAIGAPYASAVTVEGDAVTFILNESADSVKVIFNEGASSLVIGASPEPAGTKTFSKAGFTSFRIQVEKNAGPGWKSGVLQQITQDTNDLVKFANGRGVAVNRLPNTGRFFGRIYTSVATSASAAPVVVPPTPARTTNEGIYVLNADFTATPLGSGPQLGGLTFDSNTTTGTESPYRLTVGARGDLFITDWSDTQGSLYKTDGNVTGGKNVLAGPLGANPPIPPAPNGTNFPIGTTKSHGSISSVVTEGSEADNNLKVWVIDEDLQTDRATSGQTIRNSIWSWDSAGDPLPIVNSTDFTSAGTTGSIGIGFASQTTDLCRSQDGTFYKMQRRAAGAESGIFAISPAGVLLPSATGITAGGSLPAFRAYSADNGVADPFLESVACDVSEDNWLAVLRRADNAIHFVKVNAGLMDFSSHVLLYTAPTTLAARDIAFDIAGNLYTINSGQALLRVYAPGGHTRATTTSTGTFELLELTPTPPAPTLALLPAINEVTRTVNDLTLPFTSRLGLSTTIVLQRTTSLELGPWETMVNPPAPAPPIFSITGTPPNFTFKALGAFTGTSQYYYRVKRN